MKTRLSGKLLSEGIVTINGEVSGLDIEQRKSNGRMTQDEAVSHNGSLVYPGGDNDANHVISQGGLCLARRGPGGVSRANGTHGRFAVFGSFNGMAFDKTWSIEDLIDNLVCVGVSKSTYDQRSPNQIQIGVALIYRGKTTTPFDSADMNPVFPGDLLVICAPEVTALRKGVHQNQRPVTQLTPKIKSFNYDDVRHHYNNVVKWMVYMHQPIKTFPGGKKSDHAEHSLYSLAKGISSNGNNVKPVPILGTRKSRYLHSHADVEKGYVLSLAFKLIETLVTTGVLFVNTPAIADAVGDAHSDGGNLYRDWEHGKPVNPGVYNSLVGVDNFEDKRAFVLRYLYDQNPDILQSSMAHLAKLFGLGDSPPTTLPNHVIKEEQRVQDDLVNSFGNFASPEPSNGSYSCFKGKKSEKMKASGLSHLKDTMKHFATSREKVAMAAQDAVFSRIIGSAMSYGDPHIANPQIDILLTGGKFR